MKKILLTSFLLIGISACSSTNTSNWETYSISYNDYSKCRRRLTSQIDLNSLVKTNEGVIYNLQGITEEQYPCLVRTNSKLYKNEEYSWSRIVGRKPSRSKGLTNCIKETHWFESERVGPYSTTDWRKIKGKWWSFVDGKKLYRLDKSIDNDSVIEAENLLQKICNDNSG